MEIDYTNMIIAGLIIVIVALIIYEYRKPKEMQGIAVPLLLNRFQESMNALAEASKQACYKCGERLGVIKANLYEENELVLGCRKCGITEVWKRVEGKGFKRTQWVLRVHEMTDEERELLEALTKTEEKLAEEEKAAKTTIPEPPTIKGPQAPGEK